MPPVPGTMISKDNSALSTWSQVLWIWRQIHTNIPTVVTGIPGYHLTIIPCSHDEILSLLWFAGIVEVWEGHQKEMLSSDSGCLHKMIQDAFVSTVAAGSLPTSFLANTSVSARHSTSWLSSPSASPASTQTKGTKAVKGIEIGIALDPNATLQMMQKNSTDLSTAKGQGSKMLLDHKASPEISCVSGMPSHLGSSWLLRTCYHPPGLKLAQLQSLLKRPWGQWTRLHPWVVENAQSLPRSGFWP